MTMLLGVLNPGEHGSTFGGNPFALAIAREVIVLLATGEYQRRSAELGEHMLSRLRSEPPPQLPRSAAGVCGLVCKWPPNTPRSVRAANRRWNWE